MPPTRRSFLATLPAPLAIGAPASQVAFPSRQPARALIPAPAEGAVAAVNPPGFAWWRAPGAASYRLTVRRGRLIVYEAAGLPDPVHAPKRALQPGEYEWDVEACDASGNAVARRGAWRFRVPEGIPELVLPDAKDLLARVPEGHPRYVFVKDRLGEVRNSLNGTRRTGWAAVKQAADRALKLGLPERPRYDTFEGAARQRMGYTAYFREIRRYLDGGMSPLATAYLLSGDERYGLAAKKILLEVESWGVDGLMSVLSKYGDEPGLSMARHGQRAYDWLYDLFDSSERARVREMTTARARQVLTRLRRADYLAQPSESHNGRMIAYLTEYAVVLKDEAPDAAEWLDYSLRALMTFYPHWGGQDGGWAEGISYAIAYNTIYLPAIECLRAATGFDLYRRPFFRNVRRLFLYATAPRGEIKPFGDGAERGGVGGQGAALMLHHGRRFNDPACVWWAEQAGGLTDAGDPLIPVVTEDTVKAAPPSDLPNAAVFRGVGWAALHSALDRPDEDTFLLFKSSPFGSVSHSHADQNSFCIQKGGKALAIASGYYGPAYSMPHHANWTRQTKANNCVLVNGEGQVVRDPEAKGRIVEFHDQRALAYVCGDAAAAYGGKLGRFLRHVLFLRPGVFVVLDDLAAPEPARFQWLLHGLEKMTLDEAARTVTSARGGASLAVRLGCDAGLRFSLTDQFDTPYNEGNPPEYREERANQWHFTAATTEAAGQTRIGAAMIVRDAGERFTAEWKGMAGWLGVSMESARGSGEAWVQVTSGAPAPKGFRPDAKIAARWRPSAGKQEVFER